MFQIGMVGRLAMSYHFLTSYISFINNLYGRRYFSNIATSAAYLSVIHRNLFLLKVPEVKIYPSEKETLQPMFCSSSFFIHG